VRRSSSQAGELDEDIPCCKLPSQEVGSEEALAISTARLGQESYEDRHAAIPDLVRRGHLKTFLMEFDDFI
jgi:hypothetical protein